MYTYFPKSTIVLKLYFYMNIEKQFIFRKEQKQTWIFLYWLFLLFT